MEDFEERVRQQAYRLWVEEGCPEGRSEAHWDKARELVAIEQDQRLATRPGRTSGEPVEAVASFLNAGEFPTLRDQGERAAPKHRVAAASPRAAVKRKTPAEPKPPKDASAKRR